MSLFDQPPEIPNQFITEVKGISLFLKREDLLHPEVSGNKFRKLKYNLIEAGSQKGQKMLTFGGAFSNHIAATAAAGKALGIETIGVIRGDELANNLQKTLEENPTLAYAASCGMTFEFISRSDYRKKDSEEFLKRLQKKFGKFYLVPEGGTNELAIKGCEEILSKEDKKFDIICCAVGTGGTIAGIINSSEEDQRILGFPALKGDFMAAEVKKYTNKNNFEIIPDYHFGGYAKVDGRLINFMNWFNDKFDVQLDPVYTGKMMFGIFDLLERNVFLENTCILAVHTGGLQGIPGMNRKLERKNLPLIK